MSELINKRYKHKLNDKSVIIVTDIYDSQTTNPQNDWVVWHYEGYEGKSSNTMRRHFLESNYVEIKEEVKVEESNKATRYNEGKIDWSQLHYPSIEPMVRVLMFGAKKYDKANWQKSMSKEDILNSTMRHLVCLFNNIEDDHETGLSHAAHVMSNMMFYIYHFVIKK